MKTRAVKMFVVFWLGIVLASQSLFMATASPSARPAKSGCCLSPCEAKTCAISRCCAKPTNDSRKPLPARLPSTTQNEILALISVAAPWLISSARSEIDFAPRNVASSSPTAVPLYVQHCSYVL